MAASQEVTLEQEYAENRALVGRGVVGDVTGDVGCDFVSSATSVRLDCRPYVAAATDACSGGEPSGAHA